MKKFRLSLLALSVLTLGFFACNSGGEESNASADTSTEAPAETTEQPAEVPSAVTVEITGNDQMQYDKKEITVHEGQDVTLILHHSGKLPKTQMGHNWVLLNEGVDRDAFDKKAMTAAATDYIPAEMASDIIAHTKLVGGGESDTITFKAPAEGVYDYLCTFPGHGAVMNGKFNVVK